MKMKTGGWFIKNKKYMPACFSLAKKRRKFNALRLSATKCITALTEFNVTKTYILQGLQRLSQCLFFFKKFDRFIYTHFQNFINIFAFVLYVQYFFFEFLSSTYFTGKMNISKKLHFHHLFTFA